MTVSSRAIVYSLSICCLFLLCVPVAAQYTVSNLAGPPIIRGHQFTVDITGNPNTEYYIWLTGTWDLSGNAYDQPPYVVFGQLNVQQDDPDGPYTIGSYRYSGGNGRTILDDVAPSSPLLPNTSYYALVTTDSSGQAVVAFGTSINTAAISYAIRVENPTSVNNGTLIVRRGDIPVSTGSLSITEVPTPFVTSPLTPPPTTPVPQTTPPTPVATSPVVTPPETSPTPKPMPLNPVVTIIALWAVLLGVRDG